MLVSYFSYLKRMNEPGTSITIDKRLCKLTLTAPCSHLLDVLENTLAYICFTWDNIRKHIKEQQPISVVRCIKLNGDFEPLLFSPTPRKFHNNLPSNIFEFYSADPTQDDVPVTMASIFKFCAASKLDCQLAQCVERKLMTSPLFTENFYYRALLKGKMWCYSNDCADCDKLILIRLVPPKCETVPLQW